MHANVTEIRKLLIITKCGFVSENDFIFHISKHIQ